MCTQAQLTLEITFHTTLLLRKQSLEKCWWISDSPIFSFIYLYLILLYHAWIVFHLDYIIKVWLLKTSSTNVCAVLCTSTEIKKHYAIFINNYNWASLVAQWLRICLPMQGTRVQALVWEDPTCRGAARPVSHNYWACAAGACAPNKRGHDSERPAHHDEAWPPVAATRESPRTETKTQHSHK